MFPRVRFTSKEAGAVALPAVSLDALSLVQNHRHDIDNLHFCLPAEVKQELQTSREPWYADPTKEHETDNVLGLLVFKRTYSRNDETWAETIIRVTEGVFTIATRHLLRSNMLSNETWMEFGKDATKMAKMMFDMKFLPPGRGLWAMGTENVLSRGHAESLFNCGFVSTACLHKKDQQAYYATSPFYSLMYNSMSGVGMGFDTKGANAFVIQTPPPATDKSAAIFTIPDCREGWCQSVKLLLEAFFLPNVALPIFDYSEIRAKGSALKSFGGVASGPEPLKLLHNKLLEILYRNAGKPISSRDIADICNLIGCCVVAGNIRRSAEIAVGSIKDTDFLNLKNYQLNPERAPFGWASNNSVIVDETENDTDDLSGIIPNIIQNGEPGILFMNNMRQWGRFVDKQNGTHYRTDALVSGVNPCGEMTLEDEEMCNISEVFIDRNATMSEFLEAVRLAFFYCKVVTLLHVSNTFSNTTMMRNRRIGVSVTGVVQYLSHNSREDLVTRLDTGYKMIRTQLDPHLSRLFGINESIKVTTIKPSGTVSLLAGATPGMHFPISKYYLRRVIVSATHPLVSQYRDAGYFVEYKKNYNSKMEIKEDRDNVVIAMPVCAGANITKTEENVTMREQFELAALLQKYWSDNSVSCTMKFDPETEGPLIGSVLDDYRTQLKAVSMLPKCDLSQTYLQMPYETITQEMYEEAMKHIRPLLQPKRKHEDCLDNDNTALPQKRQKLTTTEKRSNNEDYELVPESLCFCDGDQCLI